MNLSDNPKISVVIPCRNEEANLAFLLDEIERDGFRVLTHRTSLTPVRKMWIAWRTWIFGASRSATPH